MKKNIKKIIKTIALIFAVVITLVIFIFSYINLPVNIPQEKASLGITFSNRYAQDIGLDWRQAYVAMLDDLKVRDIRIPAYWDLIEKEEGIYDFSDLDWQLDQARERNARIILAVGQKVPRWPECFIPEWLKNDDAKRKEKLIEFEKAIIGRYKNNSAVSVWQIENEPFLNFGICPQFDVDLLDREIQTVRNIDSSREIMITDSGELSLWLPASKRADVFGTTMYREVITKKYGSWKYPIGPNFFKMKKNFIRIFDGQKNIKVIELQGEPWLDGWTTGFPLRDQFESMNAEKLKENIEFAKKTGIRDIYLWGAEWWYWLKVNRDHPELWNEAKILFNEN